MGHAVNAVYVWSIARAFGGSVVVRIEDHDAQRARAAFDAAIQADLAWLGLKGDNEALGLPAPVSQQGQAHVYDSALDELRGRALVYACRCSRRDIAARNGTDADDEVRYPGTCRDANVPPAETPARRVRVGDAKVRFDDLRHGTQVQWPQQQCGDVLVRDRHAQWTYQFAVVVDDHRQDIDVIIRGDDLLASTGRQFRLAALLDRPAMPFVLHHALVTHPDGTKLSKSRGDTSLTELRDAGWSAARVLGHAAWMGGLQSKPQELGADELARLWLA